MSLLDKLGLKPRSASKAEPPASSTHAGDGGDSSGGAGGPPTNPSDAEMIQWLKTWEKGKQLTGSSSQLREQLSNGPDPVRQRARARFKEIADQLRDKPGSKPTARAVDTRPEAAMPPGGPKKKLGEWLKAYEPTQEEEHAFGDWLKKMHKEGNLGTEIDLTTRQKLPDDPHEHVYTKEQIESLLEQYTAEGRVVGSYRPPSRGGGGGGSGGGGGAAGGAASGTGGTGAKGTPSTSSADASRYSGQAKDLERKANAIVEQVDKLDAEAATITKEIQQVRAQFRSGKITPDKFLESANAAEKQAGALDARRQQLSKAGQALQAEAETVVAKLAGEMPAIVEAQFKTRLPRAILEQGRSLSKAGVGAGLLGVVGVIATAYFLVESIEYVMKADSVLEGVSRSLEVGAKFAAGAAAQGVLSYIAGSAAGGFGLTILVTLADDQGEAYHRGQREAARAQAIEEQQRKMAHEERLAIGRFLEQTAPGSVTWIEDFYQVNDQKLWDRTVAQVHELLAMQIAKDRARLMQRAHALGSSDGRFSDQMVSSDTIKDWDEVKNADDAMTAFLELFEEYKKGFKEGGAKRVLLEDRASKLGYADAKAGKPRSSEQIIGWPELPTLIQEGAEPARLMYSLREAYETAYDAIAAKTR
jgi:hypothetical protein